MTKRRKTIAPYQIQLTPRETQAVVVKDHGIYSARSIDIQHPSARRVIAKLKAAYQECLSHRQLTATERISALRNQLRLIIRFAVVPDGAETPKRWTTIEADIGDGPRGYVCFAERTAGIEPARDALDILDKFLESEPDERRAQVFLAGIEAGRLLEMRERVLPIEPLVVSGRRAKIERPQRMREAKAEADRAKRRQNRRRAEEALQWARRNFPSAHKKTTQKKRAAEHIGISVSQFNRWLKPEQSS